MIDLAWRKKGEKSHGS